MHVPRAARTVAVLSLLALALQQALVARWRATGADVAAPGEAAAETQLRAADAGAEPSQAALGVPSAAADDPEARPDRFTARASPRSVIGEVRRAPRAGGGRGIVVNLGLPKSGTSSLQELLAHNYSLQSAHYNCRSWRTPPEVRRIVDAFLARFKEELGSSACGASACAVLFNAIQWHDAQQQQQQQQQSSPPTSSLLPLAFAPDTVALTEINCISPQAAFVPQVTGLVRLLTAYAPGELVLVLTSRDDREWAESVRRWHGMGHRILLAVQGRWFEDHVFPDIAQDLMDVGEFSREGNAILEAWLVEFKRWHEGRVRALVAQSGHDLVELVVGSPQPRGLVENLTRLALLLQLDPAGVTAYTRANANPRKHNGGRDSKPGSPATAPPR